MSLHPSHYRCRNLVLLETYTTKGNLELPSFLDVVREVTKDPHYSMHYLSAMTTTSTDVSSSENVEDISEQ